jgi:hypothetical protein
VPVAWVVPFDELPFVNEAVPSTVPPELNVTVPVAGEPIPEALTVAVSRRDCAVCCEVRAVVVPRCVMVKLIGVKFTLELKLLSP